MDLAQHFFPRALQTLGVVLPDRHIEGGLWVKWEFIQAIGAISDA